MQVEFDRPLNESNGTTAFEWRITPLREFNNPRRSVGIAVINPSASMLDTASSWTAGRGGWLSVLLALALAAVAVSVWVPGPWSVSVRRAGVVLALVSAAVIWVFGEGLGMPFMGTGTDPDTGPLLALLAVVYWPARLLAPASIGSGAGS